MDGAATRTPNPIPLPLAAPSQRDTRATAVLPLPGGGVLAVLALCEGTEAPLATLITAAFAPASGWEAPAALTLAHSVSSALSSAVPPILLDGDGTPIIAWPLDDGGCLFAAPGVVRPVAGPGQPPTALCRAADGVIMAHRAEGGNRATLAAFDCRGGWAPFAAGAPPCAAGETVTALAAYDGRIHAAVSDARAGFGLWRAPEDGSGLWEAVIDRGAWRYGYNRAVSAMAVADGRLFVAAGGVDTHLLRLGDEHPEIFAVDPAGVWTLISGQARFTHNGLLYPAGAGGPGTPASAGQIVGGLQAAGDDLLVWLRPSTGPGPTLVFRWQSATGGWSEGHVVAGSDAAVIGLAAAGDGTILVALAEDQGRPAGGPRLVQLTGLGVA